MSGDARGADIREPSPSWFTGAGDKGKAVLTREDGSDVAGLDPISIDKSGISGALFTVTVAGLVDEVKSIETGCGPRYGASLCATPVPDTVYTLIVCTEERISSCHSLITTCIRHSLSTN